MFCVLKGPSTAIVWTTWSFSLHILTLIARDFLSFSHLAAWSSLTCSLISFLQRHGSSRILSAVAMSVNRGGVSLHFRQSFTLMVASFSKVWVNHASVCECRVVCELSSSQLMGKSNGGESSEFVCRVSTSGWSSSSPFSSVACTSFCVQACWHGSSCDVCSIVSTSVACTLLSCSSLLFVVDHLSGCQSLARCDRVQACWSPLSAFAQCLVSCTLWSCPRLPFVGVASLSRLAPPCASSCVVAGWFICSSASDRHCTSSLCTVAVMRHCVATHKRLCWHVGLCHVDLALCFEWWESLSMCQSQSGCLSHRDIYPCWRVKCLCVVWSLVLHNYISIFHLSYLSWTFWLSYPCAVHATFWLSAFAVLTTTRGVYVVVSGCPVHCTVLHLCMGLMTPMIDYHTVMCVWSLRWFRSYVVSHIGLMTPTNMVAVVSVHCNRYTILVSSIRVTYVCAVLEVI